MDVPANQSRPLMGFAVPVTDRSNWSVPRARTSNKRLNLGKCLGSSQHSGGERAIEPSMAGAACCSLWQPRTALYGDDTAYQCHRPVLPGSSHFAVVQTRCPFADALAIAFYWRYPRRLAVGLGDRTVTECVRVDRAAFSDGALPASAGPDRIRAAISGDSAHGHVARARSRRNPFNRGDRQPT